MYKKLILLTFSFSLGIFGCEDSGQKEGQSQTETTAKTAVDDTIQSQSSGSPVPGHPMVNLGNEDEPLVEARRIDNAELNKLDRLTWETMEDVTFKDEYYEEVQGFMMVPEYGESVMALENKEVFISGYLIPVDVDWYILSAFPYSACFFCGNAGPETVLELAFEKKQRRFKTDEWLTFKGKFVLNPKDIDHLPYMLTQAELIELDEE